MDAVGYHIAQSLHAAIGTPAKFSPLTIDGTAKVLMAELTGGTLRYIDDANVLVMLDQPEQTALEIGAFLTR